MKNIKNFPNLILILSLLLFMATSCQKDDGNSGDSGPQENIPHTFSEYFGPEISRDFLGNVIDQNRNPIEGVTITIGSETAMTDGNGVFMINNATINQRFGYVKAEKAGYIHGSRSVVPSNGTNKLTIMLLEEVVSGTVSSGTNGTVTSSDGSSVSFDGNFIKEDGSAYSGSVDVIMHHLDPTDDDMDLQMPGMLYAENEDGAERMLQTLGMLAVELRGSGGEDLNLADGSSSEIKMPVDASLLSSAPATIPLWYFDEANGYWKEEGEATLQGNMYVGTVSHFSFWNYDAQFPAIDLCITLVDENGSPITNQSTTLTHFNPDYLYPTTSGVTDDSGSVCGLVPLNETLELNVYSYDICGQNSLHTETVGPFNDDASITVVVSINDNTDIIQETVTGTFNTCDGNAVTDGYVQLRYGNQSFTDVVSDGNFEISLLRCIDENTFTIKGSDYVNIQTTDSISYTFNTPLTNIGTITACNAVTEFVEYTIDNGDSVLLFDYVSADFYTDSPNAEGPTINIYASSNAQNDCFYMYGLLNDPDYLGAYNNYDFDGIAGNTGFFIGECLNVSSWNNDIIFNLTTLGDVGEYIDINFSGDYEDYDGNPHTINGVVHVLRDN